MNITDFFPSCQLRPASAARSCTDHARADFGSGDGEVPFGGSAGELWSSVSADYVLDPAEKSILLQACRCLVELDRIEAELVDAPLMVLGSTGQPVPNPLLASARGHPKTLESLLRSLALPASGQSVGVVRHPLQEAAARARWNGRGEGVDG